MSPSQWLASLACSVHVVGLIAAALPTQAELRVARSPAALERPASVTAIDGAAVAMVDAGSWLDQVPGPIRGLGRLYLQAGLGPKWNMFSTPATVDEYLRLEYIVQSGESPVSERRLLELIFPAQPDDRMRVSHEYRDKAIHNALEAFFLVRASPDTASAGRNFEPLVRYFANRARASSLAGNERIVQTRVWYGTVDNAIPGAMPSDALAKTRLGVLGRYRSGVLTRPAAAQAARFGGREVEADIVWSMLYVATQ